MAAFFFSLYIHVLLLKLRPITHISNYQVRKEDKHVKRTVLKGVVGTLDLSVRCLLNGETFPGVWCFLFKFEVPIY